MLRAFGLQLMRSAGVVWRRHTGALSDREVAQSAQVLVEWRRPAHTQGSACDTAHLVFHIFTTAFFLQSERASERAASCMQNTSRAPGPGAPQMSDDTATVWEMESL